MTLEPCPECAALLPAETGLVHAYVPSSPACWRVFGEVQAEELARFGYPPAHGLVVDAYMAQHPGDGSDRRARQSVVLHLLGLCATLEHALPANARKAVLRAALAGRPDFPALVRAAGPGELTVLHMVGASDLEDYDRRAREWGRSVWDAWECEHGEIRCRLAELLAA